MTERVKKTGGRRRKEAEWRGLVAQQQASGQAVKAFCRGEQISEANFYRWRSILSDGRNRDVTVGDDTGSAFVDLGTLTAGVAAKPRLELKLDLGDGLVLHLLRG
jgi:hypothetical protein